MGYCVSLINEVILLLVDWAGGGMDLHGVGVFHTSDICSWCCDVRQIGRWLGKCIRPEAAAGYEEGVN